MTRPRAALFNLPTAERTFKGDGAATTPVLAITGGKGGVGKTTTAMGVAAALARAGRSPIVLDADRDLPDLAPVAGVERGGVSAFARGASAAAAGERVDGVTVLGAETDPDEADVRTALARLADDHRPVLVDCPAGAGRDHGLALDAADRSLLVTRRTRRAAADAVKTGVLARRLGAAPVGLVLNRAVDPGGFGRPFACDLLCAVPTVDAPHPWRANAGRYDRVSTSLVRQNV